MFPMVTDIEDWDSAMQVVDHCRRKLTDADYPAVLECFKKFNIRYFFYKWRQRFHGHLPQGLPAGLPVRL